jgi:putative ABC transport system permease protein
MSVTTRGVKNAFRNTIRSISITAILALTIALALVMLLSLKAVQARIDDVKGSVGNTVTVSPAGARGFQGGGEPLTAAEIAKIEDTAHVKSVTSTLEDRWVTEGTTQPTGPNGETQSSGTTNLQSAIDPGTLGTRNNSNDGSTENGGSTVGGNFPQGNFTLPITVTGTTAPGSTAVSGVNSFKLTSGVAIDGTSSDYVALVGKDLAKKNNLTAGSTFTAYGQTITVKGIYDTGNTFTNAGMIMPLPALQKLSSQTGDVTSAIVTVDSVDHLDATVSALEKKLGSKADVVSDATASADTLSSLDNVKTIATYSLIGALVAGSVIIFLSMLMIVRERRREIGVLKAIGSSNAKISWQFVTEALTLTGMAAVVGVIAGVILSNPVLDALVSSSSNSANGPSFSSGPGGPGGGPGAAGGGAIRVGGGITRGFTQFGDVLSNVQAHVGVSILLYGLLAAVLIAIIGTAFPSWLIAKIRPAEVMRTE